MKTKQECATFNKNNIKFRRNCRDENKNQSKKNITKIVTLGDITIKSWRGCYYCPTIFLPDFFYNIAINF